MLNTQSRITEHPADAKAQQAGRYESDRIGATGLREQRDGISADTDEGALRQRNLSGITERKIEADRGNGQHCPQRNEVDTVRLENKRQDDREHGNNRDGKRGEAAHTVRSSTRPSSPCGRNRITAMRMMQRERAAILRRDVGCRQVVENAKNKSAENGAAHLVKPADNRGEERRNAERLTVGEFREIDRTDQQSKRWRPDPPLIRKA